MGIISFFYRENTLLYLLCMGREEWFKFDLQNIPRHIPSGVGLNMALYHPYRMLQNINLSLFIFVVPLLYYKIYTFRNQQDISVKGKFKLEHNYN